MSSYFLWTTNLAPHENHQMAFEALGLYYDKYDGQLDCRVTGVNSENLLNSELRHLISLRGIWEKSATLKRRMLLAGELSDHSYQAMLKDSRYLWHAGRVDNGTFSVIEAASLGVPSLSSDYPAMREIDAQFDLKLVWMDPHDPDNMAKQLKFMELNAQSLRDSLPSPGELASQSLEQLSMPYWEAVRECL